MAIFEPGTVFANHVVVALVGAGRFAEVYEVLAPDGTRRALKVLKVDPSEASKLPDRLVQEGEAVAEIEHVHVVRFFGADVEQGRVYLLLELVQGKDLARILEDAGGALPVERAVRLVRQACEGVAAAHGRGILHRDLSPGNILVTGDDTVKVADFGSAKLARHGVKTTGKLDVSSSLTRAPEYARTGVAQPESDVYSMALVLYEALAGHHPIAPVPMSAWMITERHMRHEPPSLATLGREIPGDLSHLVQRALSKDPARRGSMREMADDLAAVLHRLHARRRAVAASVPLPNRGFRLARTERVMAPVGRSDAAEPSVDRERAPILPPAAPVGVTGAARVAPARPSSRGGTAPMPQTVVPPTLKSAEAPARLPPAPPLRAQPPKTVPMEAVEAPLERGSTAVPVERVVPAAQATKGKSRAIGPAIGAASVLVVGALLALGWSLSGGEVAGGAGSPVPPASAAPAVSASAPRAKPVAPGRGGVPGRVPGRLP